jgi:S1-C subfamily serine protease
MIVWLLGTVAIEVDSLRGDVRASAILHRLDAVLTPPGPRLGPTLSYPDPFPTFRGPSLATGPLDPLVTHVAGVRAAIPKVMRIEVLYCHAAKSGTGWIAGDGIVATNAHVAAAGQVIAAQFRGQRTAYRATPIWFDPKNDIALLRVPGVRGVPALTMTESSLAGTPGAMIGFPGGEWADRPVRLGPTSSQILAELGSEPVLPREFTHQLFGRLITAFAGRSEPGNSGSPVIDRHGHVLATVFAGGSNTGLAVPNRFVRYALRHAGPEVDTGPCPPGSSSH